MKLLIDIALLCILFFAMIGGAYLFLSEMANNQGRYEHTGSHRPHISYGAPPLDGVKTLER